MEDCAKQREVKNKKAEKPKKCLKYFFIKTFYYTEHKKSIEKVRKYQYV